MTVYDPTLPALLERLAERDALIHISRDAKPEEMANYLPLNLAEVLLNALFCRNAWFVYNTRFPCASDYLWPLRDMGIVEHGDNRLTSFGILVRRILAGEA